MSQEVRQDHKHEQDPKANLDAHMDVVTHLYLSYFHVWCIREHVCLTKTQKQTNKYKSEKTLEF